MKCLDFDSYRRFFGRIFALQFVHSRMDYYLKSFVLEGEKMPGPVEGLRAYLIVDNCFLVMLTDCFCTRFAARYNQSRLVTEAEQWIDHILEILQRFALDGNLHCPNGVANEYIPHTGQMANLRGIQRNDLNHLQAHVRANLYQVPVDIPDAQSLRTLPTAPRQLIGAGGLSDNDLSLVKLGLEMTRNNSPVYILSNDQGLLDFLSWIKAQNKHFQPPTNPRLLEGWRCMTYLSMVHRSCNITTELMQELIDFSLSDHYSRSELAGTAKGKSIYSQLLQVNRSFSQSIAIKLQSGDITQ